MALPLEHLDPSSMTCQSPITVLPQLCTHSSNCLTTVSSELSVSQQLFRVKISSPWLMLPGACRGTRIISYEERLMAFVYAARPSQARDFRDGRHQGWSKTMHASAPRCWQGEGMGRRRTTRFLEVNGEAGISNLIPYCIRTDDQRTSASVTGEIKLCPFDEPVHYGI